MKHRSFLSLLVIHAWALTVARAADGPCRRELFDFDWRFVNREAAGAENPGFDDSTW